MRKLFLVFFILLLAVSCSDKNPVNSGDGTGTAVIICEITPKQAAKPADFKPTTSAIISFYDSQNALLTQETLTVSAKRITGSVKVKAGSGYRVELLCYDISDNITHSGTASNVSIVADKTTTITIILTPAIPEAPQADGPDSAMVSGTQYMITWTEVSRAKSYTIEEAANSNFTNPNSETVVGLSNSETKITDTAIAYYYRIKANNSSGSSDWSNVIVVTVEPVTTVQYMLTMAVNQSGWGTTTPAVGPYSYDESSVVVITALPAEGYRFVNWTGNVADPGNATTTVTLTSDTTVTAVFEEEPETQYTLTLAVNNSAWGETFPAVGGNQYIDGTTVSITAVPADGYRFVSWSGVVADATSATTTVTVTANSTVTAIFEKLPVGKYSLTMTVNQPGWGMTDPPPGASTHNDGSIVTITATPASGYRFVNWTGTVADASSATTTVMLNANVTVTANFEVISVPQFTLTMAVNQSGWGTTTPSVGAHTYDENTVISISAIPAEGYLFLSWTGDVADSTVSSTTVTMTGDKTVTAKFEKIQYTLTMAVNQSGWGTTNPAVGSALYDEGTDVTITATPASGYRFVNWTGNVANTSSATTTVTMTGDKTVTANFEEIQEPIKEIIMVSIPGGTFEMGDVEGGGDNSNEKPVHTVTLSSFEMSAYEITNVQYASYLTEALASGYITATNLSVTGKTGDWSGEEYLDLDDGDCEINYSGVTFSVNSGKENHPVIEVSWYGAKAFALYYGLDLPTEAEWEYSCRAGTETKFYTGNDMSNDGQTSTDLDRAGWYWENSDTGGDYPWTHSVGEKEPNAWGLYDMHGNVWEWCNDWFGLYSSDTHTNPVGPSLGSVHVERGGSWCHSALECRSAYRFYDGPYYSHGYVGFRVVRRYFSQN